MSPSIAISGSSIAGLTLALSLLKTHSISPDSIFIFDTRDRDAKPGGPVTLTANSLRLLDHLGIYSRISARGWTFRELVYRDQHGERVGAMKYGDAARYGYLALRIERAILLDVLTAEVEARGVAVHYSHSLRSVAREDADGVHFTVRCDGADGSTQSMHAAFLIGADGLHSRTRTWVVGKAVAPVYCGTTMVVNKAEISKVRWQNGFETARERGEYALGINTRKGTVLTIPAEHDAEKLLFSRNVDIPERTREEWNALNNDKALLVRMLTQDKHEYPDIVQSIFELASEEHSYIWPVYSIPKLDRMLSEAGRAVIIGDAAHAMIPAAGQGANQAVIDAVTLAEALAAPSATEIRVALQRWEQERIPIVDKVRQLSVQLMNLRLPPEARAKLPKDEVFDLDDNVEEKWEWLLKG
nr:fad-dependent urate hydroxylase [Quercus suber]